MDEFAWPRISIWRILYATLTLSLGTTAVLFQADEQTRISVAQHIVLYLIDLFFLLGGGLFIHRQIHRRVVVMDIPLLWRYMLAILYSASPLFFNVMIYILLLREVPGAFSLYLGWLLCIFGGLTALLIVPEVIADEITKDYLEKLHGEAIQIVWPYTFSFVLTLTASPFVAQALLKVTTVASLLATISVGIVGFTSLLILPLSNLSVIRIEMKRRGLI